MEHAGTVGNAALARRVHLDLRPHRSSASTTRPRAPSPPPRPARWRRRARTSRSVAVAETYFAAHAGAAASFGRARRRGRDGGHAGAGLRARRPGRAAARPRPARRGASGRVPHDRRDPSGRRCAAAQAPDRGRVRRPRSGAPPPRLLRRARRAPGVGPVEAEPGGRRRRRLARESRAAETVARRSRRGSASTVVPVVPLAAHPGKEVLAREREDAVLAPGELVEAVAGASDERTLVVVGRGPASGAARVRDALQRARRAHVRRSAARCRCSRSLTGGPSRLRRPRRPSPSGTSSPSSALQPRLGSRPRRASTRTKPRAASRSTGPTRSRRRAGRRRGGSCSRSSRTS